MTDEIRIDLSNKISEPQQIPSNADLNDYTTVGFYYCHNNATSQTLSHNPTSNAFSLLVEKNGVGDGVKQTYTTYNTNHRTYVRTMYTDDWTDPSNPTNIWGSWYLYFEDTGWKTVSFSSGYSNYSGYNTRYRRIGKVVHLQGAFTNSNALTSSNTDVQWGSISDTSCRPPNQQLFLQQGSGANKYVLGIGTDGKLTWARYGTTAVNTSISSGSWFTCYATWFID